MLWWQNSRLTGRLRSARTPFLHAVLILSVATYPECNEWSSPQVSQSEGLFCFSSFIIDPILGYGPHSSVGWMRLVYLDVGALIVEPPWPLRCYAQVWLWLGCLAPGHERLSSSSILAKAAFLLILCRSIHKVRSTGIGTFIIATTIMPSRMSQMASHVG